MKKILIIILLVLLVVVGYRYLSPDTSNDIEVTNEERQDDLDNQIAKVLTPSFYICFNADDEEYGAFNRVMFALGNDQRAQYAQYENEGEVRTIDLSFISKDIPNPGFPNYTLTYDALFEDGFVFGRYVQTHSGIYDYLVFTNSDGETFNFTNVPQESYVSESCL